MTIDGNKRVGARTMIVFLPAKGHEPEFTSAERTAVILAVARGELAAEALVTWIRRRNRRTET